MVRGNQSHLINPHTFFLFIIWSNFQYDCVISCLWTLTCQTAFFLLLTAAKLYTKECWKATYPVYPGAISSRCSTLVWPLRNVFQKLKYHRNVVLLRHHTVFDETLIVWHAVTSEQIYTSFWWTFNSLQYFVRHKSNFPLSAEGRLKTYVCNTITWCSNRDGLGAIRNEKCLNC